MEIISHNLGAKRLLKKQLKNQTNPQTQPQINESAQAPAFTGLTTLNGAKQLAKYGAAALVLMLGTTSCGDETTITNEEYWDVTVKDNSEKYFQQIIALLEKLIAQDAANAEAYLDMMASLRDLIAAGQAQDAKYFEKIMSLMTTISSSVTNIDKNTEATAKATQDGLELMSLILENLKTNNALLTENSDKIVAYLKTIEQAVLNGNESVVAVLELMWADINNGNTKIFDAIGTLGQVMEINNQDLIDKITEIYENEHISADQRAKEIINAINEVKATVDGFKAIINAAQGDLKAQLQEFMDSYNKNEITSQKLMELMYNALLEGNTLDKLQLEQMHKIYVAMQNKDITILEALEQIKELLGNIDSSLKDISGKLDIIYNSIVNLNNDMKNGNISLAEKLEEVIKNQDDQTAYLDALVYVNKEQKVNLDKMNSQISDAVAVLKMIYEKTGKVDMDELKAILKESNANLIATIEAALKDLGIKIDNSTDDAVIEIIDAMNSFKILINGNQEKMDVIIELLGKVDVNTSLTSSQLNDLIALVKELKAIANGENANSAEISAKLDEIKNFLANIDSTLVDISAKLKDIFGAINKFADKLDGSQKDYTAYFEQLIKNTASIDDLAKSQQQTEANTKVLIEKANEAIELLKSANDKLGDLNYANLIAELERMDSDLAAQLKEMIENLGISINQNTNNAADQIIKELEGLKAILNSNNADMKEIVSQLSQLNLKADLNATQMAELLDLVRALKATVEDSGATQDDISAKLDDIKDFLANIENVLNEILVKLTEGVDNFNAFYADYKADKEKFFNSFANIEKDVAGIKANGQELIGDIADLQKTADDILATLKDIAANQGEEITFEQLQGLSAQNLAAIKAMLENIGLDAKDYMDVKIGDIINTIKEKGVDLTKTNNLLQTIINLISSTEGSTTDYTELKAIANEILNAYKAGNADVNKLLESANAKLDKIYDKICEMYQEVLVLSNSFKTYAALYETNVGTTLGKLDDIYSELSNANGKLNSLNSSASVGTAYLNSLLTKADSMIELLEKLGGEKASGITKAELEAIMKDAGVSLQTMLNNLGISINENTNNAAADIIDAIRTSGVDLTKTNNILQSILNNTTSLLDSLGGNSNVNTANVEAKLDSVLSAIKSGNGSVQAEMEALNKAVEDLLKEVKANNN